MSVPTPNLSFNEIWNTWAIYENWVKLNLIIFFFQLRERLSMQLLMSVSYMAVCPPVWYVKTYGIKSFGIEDQVRLIANMAFNLRSLLSAHFLYVKEGFTSMFPSSGKSICVITFCKCPD